MSSRSRASRATIRTPEPKQERIAPVDHGDSPAAFWAGPFGTEYTARNQVDWQARIPFLRGIIERTNASTFLDVGCNGGWNLRALKAIDATFMMSGVDVNQDALMLAQVEGFDAVNLPATEVVEKFGAGSAQMVITSGVLIHIPTDQLIATMEAIRDVSSDYVLAIEYDAPREEAIDYRGHADRLWKRPYGELFQSIGMSLVEHGQADGYHECHYWLLEKAL
jgi:SAM-dependent methyltransferase